MTSRSIALLLVAALGLAVPPAGADEGPRGWILVAYDGRITQSDRDALENAGGIGIRYLPVDRLVAHLDTDEARRVSSLPGVTSVRALTAGDKVDRSLSGDRDRPLTVSVLAARRRSLASDLATRFPVSPGFPTSGPVHDLYVFASPSAAREIAARPDVLYVGPAPAGLAPLDEIGDQIQAGNLSGANVAPGYEDWLDAHGLDGSGQVVSIVDSGIDPAHPDLLGRIQARVDYAPLGMTGVPVDEPVDTLGHGTHVAGIAGGDANGLQPATRVTDADGFLYGLGVAPAVEFVDQNALSTVASGVLCGVRWPPPYSWDQLTRDALANGASVWNASWWSCEDGEGNYIGTSRTFDELTRDADPQTEGNQPFTFVFSAGNSGPDETTVAAPASSKNVISVGASVNRRAGSPNTVASFSSRGPAADDRILPTIVSPGASVVSTRSTASTAACSVPVADGLGLYSSCSGTSMAAPHVTGAVALIREWWGESHPADPSPAMTKVLLVNSATDMGAPDIPNSAEGWGRVNLGALFDPEVARIVEDQTTVLTDLDEEVVYTVRPADPSKPLKVTLAWTDAAATAGALPALVNDLDLRVESPSGTTYLGNVFQDGTSVAGGFPNRLDNLENVFLASPEDGVHTIRVAAWNVPGDGAPGGDETDQDFALVVSNAVVAAAGAG